MAEPNMLIPLPDDMARLMKLTQWQAEQIERLRARVFALEDAQGGEAIPLAEPRTPEAQRTAEICLSEWATARMEAMEAAIAALQREAHTWSKAAETYAKQAQRTPLDPLDVEDLWDRANADDAADEVHHAFARLLERAHGIGPNADLSGRTRSA
jgi:hypothetical protein